MPVTGRAAPWFTRSLLALCVGNGAVESTVPLIDTLAMVAVPVP